MCTEPINLQALKMMVTKLQNHDMLQPLKLSDLTTDNSLNNWLVAVGFHFQSERSHAPKMKDVQVLVKI